MSRRTLAALALVATGLAGCGKLGALERPGPLFGGPGSNTASGSEDANRPVQTIDPRDTNVSPVPPRVQPIPGQGSDPNALPLPGALPNPYGAPTR